MAAFTSEQSNQLKPRCHPFLFTAGRGNSQQPTASLCFFTFRGIPSFLRQYLPNSSFAQFPQFANLLPHYRTEFLFAVLPAADRDQGYSEKEGQVRFRKSQSFPKSDDAFSRDSRYRRTTTRRDFWKPCFQLIQFPSQTPIFFLESGNVLFHFSDCFPQLCELLLAFCFCFPRDFFLNRSLNLMHRTRPLILLCRASDAIIYEVYRACPMRGSLSFAFTLQGKSKTPSPLSRAMTDP